MAGIFNKIGGAQASTFAVPVPGKNTVNTIGQMYPNNATIRPNTINGTDLQNNFGSFPKDINQGLAKQLENIRVLADTFEDEIAIRRDYDYRKIFTQETLPLHSQSLSKVFIKVSGIDEDPVTAAVTGLAGWNPEWNEVALQGSSIEVTTNAYGRFYKKHKYADQISLLDWFGQLAKTFADNAVRTLNNLAGIRMYEGANKIFVKSVAAFNDTDPNAARVTLGANASEVASPMTFEHLKVAKYLFENYEEHYTIVEKTTGALQDATRKAVIQGYYGDSYLVLIGRTGYNQLMSDPEFMKNYVVNGGFYQQQHAENKVGITSPIFNLTFELVDNPLTISKEAQPKVSTTGKQPLECAFVLGGTQGTTIGVELTLEGSTRLITVNYDEDPKVDVFGLLAMVGWFTVTDFAIIRNEALYCIPYTKTKPIISGDPVSSTSVEWKK